MRIIYIYIYARQQHHDRYEQIALWYAVCTYVYSAISNTLRTFLNIPEKNALIQNEFQFYIYFLCLHRLKRRQTPFISIIHSSLLFEIEKIFIFIHAILVQSYILYIQRRKKNWLCLWISLPDRGHIVAGTITTFFLTRWIADYSYMTIFVRACHMRLLVIVVRGNIIAQHNHIMMAIWISVGPKTIYIRHHIFLAHNFVFFLCIFVRY